LPGGLLSTVLEVVLSVGGYFLLRALDVDGFWALTVPAMGVAVVAVVVTVRRRKVDLIGLLVLCELAATIMLSPATQSPRVTLVYRTPLAHTSTMSIATFGGSETEAGLRARVAASAGIPSAAATAHGRAWPDHGRDRRPRKIIERLLEQT